MKKLKKMRLSLILGKKQIVLAALILCLSVAVYINWQYSSPVDLDVTSTTDPKNLGDAQYVSTEDNTDVFFAEAKLERQKTRDEAAMTLQTLMDSGTVSVEQKEELAVKATEIADSIEAEGKIETMIKAKGFNDCMVYYDTERVDVIVKTNGLLANEVAQMKDIIIKEVDIAPENISIIEVK